MSYCYFLSIRLQLVTDVGYSVLFALLLQQGVLA